MNKLRVIRIIVSLTMMLTLTLLAADLTNTLPAWLSAVAHVQLMPSILGLHLGILAFWLAVTLLAGRVYCSSLCPMGTLQDVIARLSGARKKKKRIGTHQSSRRRRLWRIAVVAITAACTAGGVAAVPSLIDPYSAYVRMVDTLLQPLLALLPVEAPTLTPTVVASTGAGIAVGALTLVAVAALSYGGRRTICNTICPVGATLGLAGSRPLTGIRIDTGKCVGCRMCEYKCKTGCIDVEKHTVDASSCVLCFDCLSVCRKDAITFGRNVKMTAEPKETTTTHATASTAATTRRGFLTLAALTAAASVAAKAEEAAGAVEEAVDGKKKIVRKSYPTPPTESSRRAFFTKCTACQLCVSKCPQRIIRPSTTQHGLLHLYQPYLDFSEGYCLNRCTLCADVCPTGALSLASLERKHVTAVGRAVAVNANCVTQTESVECGACARKCPHGAIQMKSTGPKVDAGACIGCGKCEHVCPAKPEKAIYVEGL